MALLLRQRGINANTSAVEVARHPLVNNTPSNGPDYVFDDDYPLRPVTEVQTFIDTHQHLPDVPSATDIEKDGLHITQMQMTPLKKVEELTRLETRDFNALADERSLRYFEKYCNAPWHLTGATLLA